MKRVIFGTVLFFVTFMQMQAQTKPGIPAHGFAAIDNQGHFQPYNFTRHAVGDKDILIDILYAGICHSDLHIVGSDWGKTAYPLVPGHEIVGRVVAVGKKVIRFKKGDYAGIGCMINSCRTCEPCRSGMEQFCEHGSVMTYNSRGPYHDNEITQGGYSDNYVVDEDFAIKIPANADIKRVAPLLCAGITTYSPIKRAAVKAGDKVAIAGSGGLGHLAVKYAIAKGAEVTVFDVSEEKRDAAIRMGAKRYINVTKPEEMQGMEKSFDFILSTIPTRYSLVSYMRMLKFGGQMGIVGIPAFSEMPTMSVADLVLAAPLRNVFGSLIGGIAETQEAIDYSVSHQIYPDVELIPADAQAIEQAYHQVKKGEVKFRYVIDMTTLKHN